MMIIAGRPASEFLGLHKWTKEKKRKEKGKEREKGKKGKRERKGKGKEREKGKKGKRALARFLQWTINIPMFSKRLEKTTT